MEPFPAESAGFDNVDTVEDGNLLSRAITAGTSEVGTARLNGYPCAWSPVGRLTPGIVFMDDTQIGTLLVPKGFEVTETFLERARNFGPGILQEKVRVTAPAKSNP